MMELHNPISGETRTRQRVLVIDDNEAILRSIRTLIYDRFEVTTAGSVFEGTECLKKERFDTIVTDYEMGDGTGFDILKFIRDHRIEVPVILVTAHGSKELATESTNSHVFGFLEKPFKPSQLKELLGQAVNQKARKEAEKKLVDFGLHSGGLIHDLANPLTIVALKVDEMRDRLKEEQKLNHWMEILAPLEASVKRMHEVVESGRRMLKGGLELHSVSVPELMNHLETHCQHRFSSDWVQIRFECEESGEILADGKLLFRVLMNLVKNAVEAASIQPQRWVEVRVQKTEQKIQFRVTDSGDGISESLREQLFQPLMSTKNENGLGLGLVVCQWIAQAHQGDLFVNSDHSNTQFVLEFPFVVPGQKPNVTAPVSSI